MKTNIFLIVVTFAAVSVVVYTLAYENGRQAGLADLNAARTAILSDPARTGATNGAAASGTPAPFGRAAGGAAGGFPGGAGGAATFIAGMQGTVDKVEGNTLTVTVTRGQQTQQIKVTVGVSTTVQQVTSGALADVKPGTRVQIGADNLAGGGQGLPSEVAARTITILPANAP